MRWSSSRPGKGMSCPQQGFAQPPDERGFVFVPDVQLRTSLPSLGTVRGDDARCTQTCAAVPGCNSATRERGSATCRLSSTCVVHEWSQIRNIEAWVCAEDALTMLASKCRGEPVWTKLDYRLPNDGETLHDIMAPGGVRQCKALCRLTPGCNQVAVARTSRRQGLTHCQLMSGCAQPAAGLVSPLDLRFSAALTDTAAYHPFHPGGVGGKQAATVE